MGAELTQMELGVEDRKDPEEWMLVGGRWVKRWRRVRFVSKVFGWDRFEIYAFCRRGWLRSRKGASRNCHLFIDLKSAWELREQLDK